MSRSATCSMVLPPSASLVARVSPTANLFATVNLSAFTLHSLVNCVLGVRQYCD